MSYEAMILISILGHVFVFFFFENLMKVTVIPSKYLRHSYAPNPARQPRHPRLRISAIKYQYGKVQVDAMIFKRKNKLSPNMLKIRISCLIWPE